jgi:hypothetical protein
MAKIKGKISEYLLIWLMRQMDEIAAMAIPVDICLRLGVFENRSVLVRAPRPGAANPR